MARSASTQTQIRHFQSVSEEIGLSHSWKCEWIADYLRFVDHHARLSLRDVEQIATLAMVTPDRPMVRPDLRERLNTKSHLYAGAVVLQVLAPRVLEKARSGQMTAEELFSVFELSKHPEVDSETQEIWSLVVQGREKGTLESSPQTAKTHYYQDRDPRELLREVIAETLDVFELMT